VNSRISTASRSCGTLLRTAAFAAACLLSTVAVCAQGTASAGAAVTGKTGVINIRQAIASTAEGKQAGAELQSQFAARQSELEGLNKQINDLRQRLEASSGKLSQEETARLTRQGEVMARQLQRKQDEYQEDVNAARENGYVVILDSSAQNTPILFASTNIDVTQDIVRLFDGAYPVKAGAATPKPTGTAPKPAATTPKPTTPPAQKPPQR
jgi:outer membrane protein